MRAFLWVVLLLIPLASAIPSDIDSLDIASPDLGAGAVRVTDAEALGPLSPEEMQRIIPRLVPDYPEDWIHARSFQETPAGKALDGNDRIYISGAGDLNGDGLADVWRTDYTEKGDDDEEKLTALLGPDLTTVLYEVANENMYLLGDVTGDGIADFAEVEEVGSDEEGEDVYTIYDGTTAEKVQELRLPRWEYETESENGTPAGGPIYIQSEYHYEYHYHFEYPIVAGDGFIIESIEFVYTYDEESTLFTSSSSGDFRYDSGVRRIDSAGKVLWERPPGGDWNYYVTDLDRDDGRDVVGYQFDFTFDGEQFRFDQAYEAIDGDSGQTRWSFENRDQGGESSYLSFPYPTQRVHGAEPEVTMLSGSDQDLKVTVINAKNGNEIHSRTLKGTDDSYPDYFVIGDINGDDLAEVGVETDKLSIQKGDGSHEYWSSTHRMGAVPDMNGDGVYDFMDFGDPDDEEQVDEDEEPALELHFVNGRSGKSLWDFVDEKAFAVDFVEDVDHDDGMEVLVTSAPFAEDGETNYANTTIVTTLLRGADGAGFWQRTIYEPLEYIQVAADRIYLSAENLGDVDGNGADDVGVELYTYFDWDYVEDADGNGDFVEQRGPGDRLSSVRVYDAATAEQIYRADAMTRSDYTVQEKLAVYTAAEDLQKDINGTPWLLIIMLSLVGVGLLAGVGIVVKKKLG